MQFKLVFIIALLISTICAAPCTINTDVQSFLALSACTAGQPCLISATVLATVAGISNLPCAITSLAGAVDLNLGFSGSGNLVISVGSGGNFLGIGSYNSLNITSSSDSIVQAIADTSFAVASTLNIAGNVALNVTSGTVLTVGTALTVGANAVLNVWGNITAASSVAIQGTVWFGGSTVNGAAQTAWVVCQNSANTISISGSASASAYVYGNGGFDGSVSCTGNVTVAPGNSPGTVYVNGDYSMDGTTTLTIEVASAGNFDRLLIRGAFNRNGILYAKFGDYAPDDGSKYTFATHSSASSSFNIAHGDYFKSTFGEVKTDYDALSTAFHIQTSSASSLAQSIALLAVPFLAAILL